jgi:hypothetical protein
MPPRFDPTIEREIGTSSPLPLPGLGPGAVEATPELVWPLNIPVFELMRRTDAQTMAVLRSITLPIRRTRWRLDGSDVDRRVLAGTQVEMGLAPEGRGRRRRRGVGISFDEALRHSLLSVPFGHMMFEPVYSVGPPTADQAGPNVPPLVAHLHRLSPRMPRTIGQFNTDRHGDLVSIDQWTVDAEGRMSLVTIPRERLVVHVHEQEGSDYSGTSLLRPCYKHWLIKEALERLGPLACERNGMGLAVVTFDSNLGGTEAKALDIARNIRAGEKAGVALPVGYTLELMGVKGETRDELPLIKYHAESIGKNGLAMLLDLGHDAGARSLGQTFLDVFTMSLNALVAALEETWTEEIIRPWVALTFGEDEPYPELVADELQPGGEITAEALRSLVEANVILPDDDLEDELRRRWQLPPRPAAEVPRVDPAPAPGPAPAPLPAPPDPNGPPQPPARPARLSHDELASRAREVAARLERRRRVPAAA